MKIIVLSKGMGVPWVAQVRLLHLAILGLTTVSLVLYVAYMSTPQPHTTVSPVLLPVSLEFHVPHTNTTQSETSLLRNDTSPTSSRNVSSEAPPPVPPSSNNSVPDLTRGVPAEIIYEAGHTDVSSNLCPELGKNLQLLIVITSAPSHEGARMAIRQTWGHFAARRDVAIAFMLGTTPNTEYRDRIDKEEFMYEDIIRGKFIDTYENLTLKTISMLEWVENYCPKAAFVLKTDDDMFINIPRLLTFISKRNPELRAIYGRLAKKWKPIRNKKSKYYISPQQYKPAVFPDFTTGPAYLFPARLSKDLYSAALNHTYFKLEDVFLTGIVANDLKIKRIHAPEFLNKRVSLTPCSVQRGISIHMVKGDEQFDLWKKLLDGHAKCK
ncbi:hypothetical protein ILUMI_23871 [Ignelater luminosus]|uniref:Hexosyltransferase n=1 Tax=Ignelater luminosus TaxID=2038154 RepID=A0A8K0CBB4_IGNLU|nr:hypothetical protein ILUMI_23871 [Ignelater luminosus]